MSFRVSWKRSSSFFGSLAMVISSVRCGEPSELSASSFRIERRPQADAGTYAILHRMSVFCPTRDLLFGSGAAGRARSVRLVANVRGTWRELGETAKASGESD